MPELNPKSAHGNMEKIRLEITGLSYSQLQSGAYATVLNEKEGPRAARLPTISLVPLQQNLTLPSRKLSSINLWKAYSMPSLFANKAETKV